MENDSTKNSKNKFYKDKKNIIILVLIMLLLITGTILCISILSKKDLTSANNSLQAKIEETKATITELEGSNSTLQEEINTLKKEKQQLESEKNNSNYKTTNSEKKPTSSTQTTTSTPSNPIIGSWKTYVTDSVFDFETHRTIEKNFTTIYEFKEDGSFYVNYNKVGTYKDGTIFFKDSNDPDFRSASYNMTNGILYMNLYQNDTDICVSSSFYECTKN